MTSAKLKRFSYEVCVMDLSFDSFRISDIKSSKDFFQAVKKSLCRKPNRETFALDLDWNENKKIKHQVVNEDIEFYKPKIGEIQIFQMNIAKDGIIEFDLDLKIGAIKFHTSDVGGRTILDKITQNSVGIDFDFEDFGQSNEQLLVYVAKLDDGSIREDSLDACFSYTESDMNEVHEELDDILLEITNEWYEAIFKRK